MRRKTNLHTGLGGLGGGFGGVNNDQEQAKKKFLPCFFQQANELNALNNGQSAEHIMYACGNCGANTNGRVLVDKTREIDGKTICWCICSCPKEEPAIVIEENGKVTRVFPEPKMFKSGEKWPTEIVQIFDEAALSFSSGAYTAAAMLARKVLMVCSHREGAKAGEQFTHYVDHITTQVLTFSKAKNAIDAIRKIGNEANHDVALVPRDQAQKSLEIVKYLLDTIYTLPSAHT